VAIAAVAVDAVTPLFYRYPNKLIRSNRLGWGQLNVRKAFISD